MIFSLRTFAVAAALFAGTAFAQQQQQPECLSQFGRTACGFHCVAQFGKVACAQTPAGACEAQFGKVTCWDPPVMFEGQPQAECLSQFGTTVCGYHCVAQFGKVACAQTPQGMCQAEYGKVTCWDPQPQWGRGRWRDRR
ncbi:MAG: hypothetical protein U0228_24965 [Myxococcaceae bacterium]